MHENLALHIHIIRIATRRIISPSEHCIPKMDEQNGYNIYR